uniref:transketolase C-terminal domain-containing protein n=1 Tax=Butyrivibrio sp. TaxID=28121 RepID=UPI0025FE51F5
MENLVKDDKPAYIRLRRGAIEDVYAEDMSFVMDKAEILSEGRDVAIITCGDLVPNAVNAANILRESGIEATVVDMYCIKPLDENTVLEVANKCRLIVTCEEHSVYGGLGSLIARVLSENTPVDMMCLALPDAHLVAGGRDDIYREY